METTRLPQPTDIDRVSAHHTISVEPFCDHRRPDVHEAVVERDQGVVVQVWCCDVEVREGATLDAVAHAYAEMCEADYVAATEGPPMSLTTEFTPGHRRDTTATITLEGGHEIFRFAVNMLFQQVEFAAAGRTLLVELREHLTPERFDPMARSLLGEDRYGKLRDRFERDRFCTACETKIKTGDKYGRIENAAAVCKPCVDELDPPTVELFEMAEVAR